MCRNVAASPSREKVIGGNEWRESNTKYLMSWYMGAKSEKKYCKFCNQEIRPIYHFCSLRCELLHTKILNRRNEIKRKNVLKKV